MNETSSHVIAFPAVGVAIALFLGCQPSPQDAATGDVASVVAHSEILTSTAPAAPEPLPPSVDPEWPHAGQAVVEVDENGISLSSNGAPRLAVLEKLANLLGFRVVRREVEPGTLSGTLVEAEIHEAVSFILDGLPYATRFTIDSPQGRHRLVEVQVGASVQEEPSIAGENETFGSFQSALNSAQVDRWHADHPTLSLQLADSDPQARTEVLETLDPESDDISVLAQALASDPDAHVREIAVNQLYGVQTYAAIKMALDALQDPAPAVVVAALDLIEEWHDPSLVPDVNRLTQHPSTKVRTRATEVIALLE